METGPETRGEGRGLLEPSMGSVWMRPVTKHTEKERNTGIIAAVLQGYKRRTEEEKVNRKDDA